MLDFSHLASSTKADVQVFTGDGSGVPRSWLKPRGVSMIYMFAVGSGGNGGNGVVGAASTAAGGGGGGSANQGTLLIPAVFVPDVLTVQVFTASVQSSVVCLPNVPYVANNCFLRSDGGGNGGNASGATGGTAGGTSVANTIAQQCLAGMGRYNFLAGQAGTASTGGRTLPTTGLCVTGGTSGGEITAAQGFNGGNINDAGGVFGTSFGGWASNAPTTPPENGNDGYRPIPGLNYFFGGTGGGPSHGAATGAGLVGGMGGNGAPGCGGGGGGGALTGSTQGLGGRGGPGLVIIIAW